MFGKKGIKDFVENKGRDAVKVMKESFNTLENHSITIQQNQVEFEKYLKDITKKLEKMEKEITELKKKWQTKN